MKQSELTKKKYVKQEEKKEKVQNIIMNKLAY